MWPPPSTQGSPRVTADQAGATPVVNAAKLSGLTSDQLVRSDTDVTGHFNCLGIGMQPWASGMEYSANDQGRYMTEGPGLFNCMVNLPNGATITAMRAAVKDNSTSFQATCYLIANSNAYPNDGYTPAFTPFSGDVTTPGDIVLEDTTIERPVVDNTTYAYLAECSLDGPGTALVLKSVSIEYSVAGLPVP